MFKNRQNVSIINNYSEDALSCQCRISRNWFYSCKAGPDSSLCNCAHIHIIWSLPLSERNLVLLWINESYYNLRKDTCRQSRMLFPFINSFAVCRPISTKLGTDNLSGSERIIVTASNFAFLSVSEHESQLGHPIGKALVMTKTFYFHSRKCVRK